MSDQRYDDLRALFVNTTLKRSAEPSNTQGLIDVSARIMSARPDVERPVLPHSERPCQ